MGRSYLFSILGLLLSLLGHGCATVSEAPPSDIDGIGTYDTLPLVLGVKDVKAVRLAGGGSEVAEESEAFDLVFSPDELALMRDQLRNGLAPYFLEVVTVKDEDGDGNIEDDARELGVDVLLLPQMMYDDTVRSETNDRFWLNLPLFLLGGPMCWFVNDRTYEHDVSLVVQFHSVSSESGTQTDRKTLHQEEFENRETPLDFLDRADGAGDYALSLVCPSGWLATETDESLDSLRLEIGESLVSAVVADLSRKRGDILNSTGANFILVEMDVKEGPEGKLLLEGKLDLDENIGFMGDCLVWCGDGEDEAKLVEFGAYTEPGKRGQTAFQRLTFTAELPNDSQEKMVRVRLQDGTSKPTARTYSFDLEDLRRGVAQEVRYTGGLVFERDETSVARTNPPEVLLSTSD